MEVADQAGQLTAERSTGHEAADAVCVRAVYREVRAMLAARRGAAIADVIQPQLGSIARLAAEDLIALTVRDPAALGSWRYVLDSYGTFRAVLAHRLASAVVSQSRRCSPRRAEPLLTLARRISEDAKVVTGVEIHPCATIGRRFVLDHGTGTVIGETTVIGADCYVLQGVVLGATGIALNPTGKRHPTLGDRVEIGASARILGPVKVGDDVFVGPGVIVTGDLPDGSRVRMTTQCQVSHPAGRASVYGVVPVSSSDFDIHGTDLEDVRIELLDAASGAPAGLPVETLRTSASMVRCRVGGFADRVDELVRVVEPTGADLIVTALQPVWRRMRALPREAAP